MSDIKELTKKLHEYSFLDYEVIDLEDQHCMRLNLRLAARELEQQQAQITQLQEQLDKYKNITPVCDCATCRKLEQEHKGYI